MGHKDKDLWKGLREKQKREKQQREREREVLSV